MAAGEVGAALKVAHQEGDPTGFKLTPTIVDGLLQDGGPSGKLADLSFDELLFFLPLLVVYDLGIGLPVGQLMEGFCEGVEPCSQPAKQLKEPGPHGVGWDA